MKLLLALLVLLSVSTNVFAKGETMMSLDETFKECARLAKGLGKRAPASISDDLETILALEEAAKAAALEAKREEIRIALEPKYDRTMRSLCSKAADEDNVRFLKKINSIRAKNQDNFLGSMTVGEYAFFADCKGRNAFENNITTNNIKFDSNGVSPLTMYMLEQMEGLLAEKGNTGMTPLEFVTDSIRSAQEAEAYDLAAAYGSIRQEILERLGILNNTDDKADDSGSGPPCA